MSAEPIRLSDWSDDPRGRRYTDEDRALAYESWRTVGGRSLRRTAEIVGVAVSTLGTWQQRDNWIEKAKQDDAEGAESYRVSIRQLALPRANAAIEVIESIMNSETASPRDRLEAAKWMAGIAGISPITKMETSFITAAPKDDETRIKQRRDYMNMSDEELAALERGL
jgi:hypothetical protein